ncbi:hypothetical protein [Paraburkholderia saeva]|uniref:hypothetical protein n=1 Tax=Paraburkholderia saeva TaxID=2777537 RepID=UPI001DF70063|nr:hypothetical protein [Paraburkholderia saeva]CAG4926162.1 hypothetical protein R70241_05444 [Paraburkholderia saeva]
MDTAEASQLDEKPKYDLSSVAGLLASHYERRTTQPAKPDDEHDEDEDDAEDTTNYAFVFASITDAERQAIELKLTDSEKAGDQTYTMPDGSTVAVRGLTAAHVHRLLDSHNRGYEAGKRAVDALPVGMEPSEVLRVAQEAYQREAGAVDLSTLDALGLHCILPALEYALPWNDAYLAWCVSLERKDANECKARAEKLAAYVKRPEPAPVVPSYRAVLNSMTDFEKTKTAAHVAQYVDERSFAGAEPDGNEWYKARRFTTLEDLDVIEALDPDWAKLFDALRPAMREGLTYPEALAAAALINTRAQVTNGEPMENPQ